MGRSVGLGASMAFAGFNATSMFFPTEQSLEIANTLPVWGNCSLEWLFFNGAFTRPGSRKVPKNPFEVLEQKKRRFFEVWQQPLNRNASMYILATIHPFGKVFSRGDGRDLLRNQWGISPFDHMQKGNQ